jgi:hypothetical protein
MDSGPVLLVVNADTCRHCKVLIEKKDSITKAVKSKFPKINNVWVSLDKMSFSLFPFESIIPVKYFPMIFYFPTGSWESYLSGDVSRDVHIMGIDLGLKYDVEGIITWLDLVVEPQYQPVIADKWSQPQTSLDDFNQTSWKELIAAEVREFLEEKYAKHLPPVDSKNLPRYKLNQQNSKVSSEPIHERFNADHYRVPVERSIPTYEKSNHVQDEVSSERSRPIHEKSAHIQDKLPFERSMPFYEPEAKYDTRSNAKPHQHPQAKCGDSGIKTEYGFDYLTKEIKLSVGSGDVKATIAVNAHAIIDAASKYLRL